MPLARLKDYLGGESIAVVLSGQSSDISPLHVWPGASGFHSLPCFIFCVHR